MARGSETEVNFFKKNIYKLKLKVSRPAAAKRRRILKEIYNKI
jgi:hypothetical protein